MWRHRAEIPTWRRSKGDNVAGSRTSAGLEESFRRCPMENRRLLGSGREWMVEGFPLGTYGLLVDYTGQLFREGKAATSRELAAIFDRLGTTAESWWVRLATLGQARFFGRVFAATRDRLLEVANRLGLRRLASLGRCPAR
jgi:hypothetical protein